MSSALPHPGQAIMQFMRMRDKANEIADKYFEEYGGAAVGKLVHDEDSGLHYIAATGLLAGDIEIAKTHVWEDDRVETVFGKPA